METRGGDLDVEHRDRTDTNSREEGERLQVALK